MVYAIAISHLKLSMTYPLTDWLASKNSTIWRYVTEPWRSAGDIKFLTLSLISCSVSAPGTFFLALSYQLHIFTQKPNSQFLGLYSYLNFIVVGIFDLSICNPLSRRFVENIIRNKNWSLIFIAITLKGQELIFTRHSAPDNFSLR